MLLEPSTLPNLGSRHFGRPFGISYFDIGHRKIIKLSIEFPLRTVNSKNDIELFFKRFITVLFAANKQQFLTKWIPGNANPISKAIDIAYTDDSSVLDTYYAGMKTLHDKKKIIGFTRIISSNKFHKTKNHPSFRAWLTQNKVWVRPTTLPSSKHVEIGWLLCSHPTYTHFKTATEELIKRIGADPPVELELLPRTLTHHIVNNQKI